MNKATKNSLEEMYDQILIFKQQLEIIQLQEQIVMNKISEESERYESLEENDIMFDEAIESLEQALSAIDGLTD